MRMYILEFICCAVVVITTEDDMGVMIIRLGTDL